MKHYLIFLLATILVFSAIPAVGQQWSADQLEVWKNVNAYWSLYAKGDVEGFISYFHEDFTGWSPGNTHPDNKVSRVKFVRYSLPKTKILVYQITPAAIAVHDDVAIVHYYFTMVVKEGEAKERTDQGGWTDILKKQGSKWVMIGDSGSPAK